MFKRMDKTNKDDFKNSWEVVYSGHRHTVMADIRKGLITGFGLNTFTSNQSLAKHSKWTIPVRKNLPIKRIVGGHDFILILYETGLLEGYGRSNSGGLGIGVTRDLTSGAIVILPDGEEPHEVIGSDEHCLIVSKQGHLYVLGRNYTRCLSFDRPIDQVNFPKRITLPNNFTLDQIYTCKDRTIITSKEKTIYGFGSNYNLALGFVKNEEFGLQRLAHFEHLNPKYFCLGHDATLVVDEKNTCYFFGINSMSQLPIDYAEQKVRIPSHITPQNISFNHFELLITTTNQEVWIYNSKPEVRRFEKIDLPEKETVSRIYRGLNANFVFCNSNNCYVWGDNKDGKLGVDILDELLPLTQLKLTTHPSTEITLNKTIPKYHVPTSTTVLELSDLQATAQSVLQYPYFYTEINRPKAWGKSLVLSYLHEQEQRERPVLYFDLSLFVDSSDYSFVETNFQPLVRGLYIKYREILFEGILKHSSTEWQLYQNIANQSTDGHWDDENPLKRLIQLLYRHYKKEVLVLIDNADSLRSSFNEKKIKAANRYINTFLGALHQSMPCVEKCILMGVHPSGLVSSSQDNFLNTAADRSLALDIRPLDAPKKPTFFTPTHVIHSMKVSHENCKTICLVLEGKPQKVNCNLTLPLDTQKPDIFSCLIQLGLFEAKIDAHDPSLYLVKVANDVAGEVLYALYRNWIMQHMKLVTVVLDVDHVLLTNDNCADEVTLFFLRKGVIFSPNQVTQYVLPGVLELLQYLFSLTSVNVVFYSAAEPETNELRIKALLIKALGEKHYEIIADKVKIFSSDKLIFADSEQLEVQKRRYGFYCEFRQWRKDLRTALGNTSSLEYALLIDNAPSNIYPGQEDNYLYSETVLNSNFQELLGDCACSSSQDLLFRKINTLYRTVAILKACIENKETNPITSQLRELHFKPVVTLEDGTIGYEPQWSKFPSHDSQYDQGLELLKRFNPALTFTTVDSFRASIAEPMSEEEQEAITVAKNFKYVENVISFG